MDKQLEIRILLTALATTKGLGSRLTFVKIEQIALELSLLNSTNRQTVKSIISYDDVIIKESIDWSDTDYWIDRIVDIINTK